jgi:hypothetical protein
MPNTIMAILAAFIVAVLGFMFWYQRQHPREIVGTGAIELAGVRGSGRVTLKTRDVAINGVVFKEIEMPNGTWLDCAGDCAKAAREAGDGFWTAQTNNRR